jgi:hypothetical protein
MQSTPSHTAQQDVRLLAIFSMVLPEDPLFQVYSDPKSFTPVLGQNKIVPNMPIGRASNKCTITPSDRLGLL